MCCARERVIRWDNSSTPCDYGLPVGCEGTAAELSSTEYSACQCAEWPTTAVRIARLPHTLITGSMDTTLKWWDLSKNHWDMSTADPCVPLPL